MNGGCVMVVVYQTYKHLQFKYQVKCVVPHERNCSMFENIHSKKRNRLDHLRLNEFVYVHYNLRLQQW